jgi:glycosyltransferase involved in cell wall biosynthesis
MKITFVSRSPGTGHSIEMLFGALIRELCNGNRISPSQIEVPYISQGLRSVWKNIQSVRGMESAVVHVTGDIHYVVLACKANHTVLTIHDCVILGRNRQRPLRFVLFKLLWYYLPMRRAAVITTVSEKTKQELYQYVGKLADRVVVIPNGYDPAFTFRRKQFNLVKPTLLHIGTSPHKNLDRLMEAIEGLPCRLVIVGQLTDLQKANLVDRRIEYEQYQNTSQADIIRLYERCDIVTFVSLYEGFGMPVLEGQVVGRPVVTSNSSPMVDVGGAGACYVDPTNVADIRRGILRVCQDESYRDELIRAGRENAQQYTIERIAAQYADLYTSLEGKR